MNKSRFASSSCRAWAIIFALLIPGLVILPACDSAQAPSLPPADASTLRIVSSLPLRGQDGAGARQVQQAIDLAISQRGGRAGSYKIEHNPLDDGDPESGDWSPKRERTNAQSAADDPSVVAYIGPYNSGAAGVALPLTNQAHLLEILPAATWPGLTTGGWNPGEPEVYFPSTPRNIARLAPPDTRQANAAAAWVKEDGATPVLVVDDGSSYSKGLGNAFKIAAQSAGLQVSGPETIDPAGQDLVVLVRERRPGAIFYAPSSAGQAAKAAGALAEGGFDTPVYTTDTALSDQFLEQAGENAADWHIVFNGIDRPANSSKWEGFAGTFKDKFGLEPSVAAARAFDGTNIVLDAVASGAETRDQVLKEVLGGGSHSGASGEITLDSNGDVRAWEITGYVVVDGGFTRKQVFAGER